MNYDTWKWTSRSWLKKLYLLSLWVRQETLLENPGEWQRDLGSAGVETWALSCWKFQQEQRGEVQLELGCSQLSTDSTKSKKQHPPSWLCRNVRRLASFIEKKQAAQETCNPERHKVWNYHLQASWTHCSWWSWVYYAESHTSSACPGDPGW